MRKYELWIAFVLAMILMFLASCRSKQVVINEQVDSVSVKAFTLADMWSQRLDFSFDSMCFEVDDTCMLEDVKGRACKVKVMGGRMRVQSEQSSVVEKRDSDRVQTEYRSEKMVKPPEHDCMTYIWVLAFILAIVFGVIIRKFVFYIL